MTSLIGQSGMKGSTATGQALRGAGATGNKVPKGYSQGQMQQFTPEQMELFQQMFGQVGSDSYTGRLAGGDQSQFDEMEAPALRQFNELQGNISSRYSGMGGRGARKSSGFQNEMSAASSNFAQELQAKRQGLQRQAIQDLRGMSNDLLGQRPYDQFLVEKPQNQASGWGALAGAGLGAAGGFFAGGGLEGALKGGKLGYSVGSSF